MKKFPNGLLAMGLLVGGASNVYNWGEVVASGENMRSLGENSALQVALDSDAGVGENLGIEGILLRNIPDGRGVEELLSESGLKSNVYDPRVDFLNIKPGSGTVELRLGNLTYDYEWSLRRVVLATYNYNIGITEQEADIYALGLGEEQEVQWTLNRFEDVLSYNASSWFWWEKNMVRGDLAELSKSDIIYYALEFENLSDANAEPVWIRGKLDYRSCVHSLAYATTENKVCEARVEDGKYVFLVPGEFEVEEGILTWEEELLGILRKDLEIFGATLVNQEAIKADGGEVAGWWIDSREAALNQSVEVIVKLGYEEQLDAEIASLRSRLAALRTVDTGGDETTGDGNTDNDDGDASEDEGSEGSDDSGSSGGDSDDFDGDADGDVDGSVGTGGDSADVGTDDGTGGGADEDNSIGGVGGSGVGIIIGEGGKAESDSWVGSGEGGGNNGTTGTITDGYGVVRRSNGVISGQNGDSDRELDDDSGDSDENEDKGEAGTNNIDDVGRNARSDEDGVEVPKLGGEGEKKWFQKVFWLVGVLLAGLVVMIVRWAKRKYDERRAKK